MTFKKGQSGNPAGRPKRKNTFKTLLESLPDDKRIFQHPEYGELEPDELAALMLVEAAGNGESWAVKDLLDRMMGKPHQTTENTNINQNHEMTAEKVREQLEGLGPDGLIKLIRGSGTSTDGPVAGSGKKQSA